MTDGLGLIGFRVEGLLRGPKPLSSGRGRGFRV